MNWRAAAQRARDLAQTLPAAADLLVFYAAVIDAQASLAARLGALAGRGGLTGVLAADAVHVRAGLADLLRAVDANGPEPLRRGVVELRHAEDAAIDEMLLDYWTTPSDLQFFAKALLQPYARALADASQAPRERSFVPVDNCCPFCGGPPQVATFHAASASGDGGRRLHCALCLTAWPFRRILCAHCGEEDERKVGYYEMPGFDHVSVEACDVCRHYLKCVDLGRLGLAVPFVDEVAASTLDVWAHERGFIKIERNLIGL